MKQKVSLVQHREIFRQRLEALKALMLVAYHNACKEDVEQSYASFYVLSSDTSRSSGHTGSSGSGAESARC